MKNFLKSVAGVAVFVPVFALITGVAIPASSTYATGDCSDVTSGLSGGLNCGEPEDGRPTSLFDGEGAVFKTVINVMLFAVGALSVIMLIYGGIRYTISQGDSGAVTNAKNTILYAVIGIIVSILAYAIVNFVVDSFTN